MKRFLIGLSAMMLVAGALSGAARAAGEELDLGGTRRGPTGWFLSAKERADLRKRIEREEWAADLFRKRVLPKAEEGDPYFAGLAYVATGEAAYVETCREFLLKNVEEWATRDEASKQAWFNSNNPCWGGMPGSRSVPKVYSLVADALSPEDERKVRLHIKELLHYLRDTFYATRCRPDGKGSVLNPNMKGYCLGPHSAWAVAIGYDEFVDYLLDHDGTQAAWGGFKYLMAIGTINSGELYGEAPVYGRHYFVVRMTELARNVSRYTGKDYFSYEAPNGATLKKLADSYITMAWPIEKMGMAERGSIRTSNWSDGSTDWVLSADSFLVNGPRNMEEAIEAIYRFTGDATYGWLMWLTGRDKRFTVPDLLYGPLDLQEKFPAPPARSRAYPEAGLAMLRSVESPDYWSSGFPAAFMRGPSITGMGHDGTRAYFHLNLWGAGRLLYPHFNVTQYENPKTVWSRARINANAVVVDGRETSRYDHCLERHDFSPEFKFVSMRSRPYDEAAMERTLMLTREYLLDAYLVESADGDAHVYDWVLHGLGRLYHDSPDLYEPSREFTDYQPRVAHLPSNCWVLDERKRATSDSFHVDWVQKTAGLRRIGAWRSLGQEWFDGGAGVRMRMLGAPGTTVYTGKGPMRWGPVDEEQTPEEIIPLVVVRRPGKRQLFVALHEPYEEKPSVRGFRYICRPRLDPWQGESAGPTGGTELVSSRPLPVVGVEVEGPGYTDRLFIAMGLEAGPARPPLFGQQEISRLRDGWVFKRDPDKVGEKEKWFGVGRGRSGWKPQPIGVGWHGDYPNYYGSGWYANTFRVPGEFRGKPILLNLTGVDEMGWVYVNGKLVGDNYKWDVPFSCDISEAVDYEGDNLVVIHVHASAYQAGLYGDVTLHAKKTAEIVPETVTARSEPDGREQVTFTSHAYFREREGSLTVRGEVRSFALYAPDVAGTGAVTVNGGNVAYRKERGYVLFGDEALEAPAGPPAPPAESAGRLARTLPVEFTADYVNVDAVKGGEVSVTVENTTDKPISGRLEMACGNGVSAQPERRELDTLAPGETRKLSFGLAPWPGTSGKTSVEALLYVAGPRGRSLAGRLKVEVAVGVVAELIRETFEIVLVRAPGYTFKINCENGSSRWIADPAGKVRTYMGWYPFSNLREDIDAIRLLDFVRGYLPREQQGGISHVAQSALVTVKGIFDWTRMSTFLGIGKDPETGHPTATFRSGDGARILTYLFTPGAIEVRLTSPEEPRDVRIYGVNIENPDYPFFRETLEAQETEDGFLTGVRFGFRR